MRNNLDIKINSNVPHFKHSDCGDCVGGTVGFGATISANHSQNPFSLSIPLVLFEFCSSARKV